jgi:hypothetical protein
MIEIKKHADFRGLKKNTGPLSSYKEFYYSTSADKEYFSPLLSGLPIQPGLLKTPVEYWNRVIPTVR